MSLCEGEKKKKRKKNQRQEIRHRQILSEKVHKRVQVSKTTSNGFGIVFQTVRMKKRSCDCNLNIAFYLGPESLKDIELSQRNLHPDRSNAKQIIRFTNRKSHLHFHTADCLSRRYVCCAVLCVCIGECKHKTLPKYLQQWLCDCIRIVQSCLPKGNMYALYARHAIECRSEIIARQRKSQQTSFSALNFSSSLVVFFSFGKRDSERMLLFIYPMFSIISIFRVVGVSRVSSKQLCDCVS